MFGWFSLNKYTALVIILIFLIICYYATRGKKEFIKKGGKSKKNKNKPKGKGSRSKPSRKNAPRSNDEEDDPIEDVDESTDGEETEEDNINKDAEELYNVVHDGLCNGIQNEEFEELAGDLADTSIFIELKQMYNQCTQKGLDPNKTITVNDYVRILKEENV